jgi:hypothetical protein
MLGKANMDLISTVLTNVLLDAVELERSELDVTGGCIERTEDWVDGV